MSGKLVAWRSCTLMKDGCFLIYSSVDLYHDYHDALSISKVLSPSPKSSKVSPPIPLIGMLIEKAETQVLVLLLTPI